MTDNRPAETVPDPGDAPVVAASPPTLGDLAWAAGIATVKSAVVVLAVDAFLNSSEPRYHGKGMRIRAIGYTAGLLATPIAWRLRGRREPYPRALDLAVTVPLLIDAGGNAIGIYRRAHVDDLIHFADGAIASSVVGALATPRVRTPWEAAGIGAAAGAALAGVWEIGEWVGMKLGAKGMNLSYDDTIIDLAETMAGGLLGAVVTLLRHPTRLRHVPGEPGDPIIEEVHLPREVRARERAGARTP